MAQGDNKQSEPADRGRVPPVPRSKLKKLPVRQSLFAVEYVKVWNAEQAALRAGYTRTTARKQAHRLLADVGIAAAIKEAQARLLAGAEISVERSLREVAPIAYFDLAELYDPDGNLLPVRQMPEHARRALTGVKHYDGKLREARFTGKLEANEKILRHLAAFPAPPQAVMQVEGRITVQQLRAIWALGQRVLPAERLSEMRALPAPAIEQQRPVGVSVSSTAPPDPRQ